MLVEVLLLLAFAITANTQNWDNFVGIVLNSGTEASQGTINASLTSSQNLNVKLNYNNGGVPTSRYLDYIIF
jgi:hypothetical protein